MLETAPPNKRMQLTKRGLTVGRHGTREWCRAAVTESRFAADAQCSAYANGGRIGNDETGSLANGNDMSPHMQRRWDAGSDPASIGVAPSRPSQRLARRGSGCEYPSSTVMVRARRSTDAGSTERWLVRRPDRSSGRNPGQHPRRQPASAGVGGVPPNEALQLTKRDHHVGGRALACLRRAIFIESRFAAYAQCSTTDTYTLWSAT